MRALAIVSIVVASLFPSVSAQAGHRQTKGAATDMFSLHPPRQPSQFGSHSLVQNRDETNPFTIHWPSQSYPCSTVPQFCPGYHGSNGR
jgi:hypothetical protein